MKKKLLGVLLCFSLSAAMLIGCGSGSEEAENGNSIESGKSEDGGETVLTFWSIATESDSFHNAYNKAIEEYEAEHEGVKIEMETFENQSYKTKIKSAVSANELPDIFFTWGGGFSEAFVESGKVLNLDEYYTEYQEQLPKAALEYQFYDGSLYGTTFATPVSMMFYNKSMFEEHNLEVPTTWDELKAVCQTFVDAGITPIGMTVKDTWVLAMTHDAFTLKSAGPDKVANALTKNGQSYNDPDFIAATEKVVELIDMGAFSKGATGISNDEAVATFLAEDAAMFISGSWVSGQVAETEMAEHFDVAPVPVMSENAQATDFMGGAVDTFMVNSATENPDLAAEAAFELAKKISEYAYLDGAGIPAWEKDYDDAAVNDITKKVAEYTADATSFTIWFDTLMDATDAGEYLALLQELYSGNIDATTFAESMDAQLNK